MEYFPKSLVFWKGVSSALAILLKEEGQTSSKKNNLQFFSQRTPTRADWSKAEEELSNFIKLVYILKSLLSSNIDN